MKIIIRKTNLYILLVLSLCIVADAVAYSTRVPVTVSNPTAAALTNHSMRIELNAGNAPGFDWGNSGNDILVTDPSFVALDYYLESFDGIGQTAVLWVEVPSIPVSPPDTTVYVYYDDATATSTSSAANTFVNSGFKYHTQPYADAAPGPESRTDGEALFNFDQVTANTNYGCSAVGSIELDNSGTYGSNGDIAYFYETFFDVPVGATYEFRMGNDFGHGGELYVDDTTVEADWSDDLWWGFNYSSTDTLTGSIALTAGTHTLKSLGFERCCDGPSGIQYRTSPVGAWVDFEVGSPGLNLYAPSCPLETSTIGPPESVPVTLSQFESFKAGPYYRFNWQTVSETFNVGFNVWAKIKDDQKAEDEQWVPLNSRLVRSHSTDSTKPETYRFDFNNSRRQLEIEAVALSSVDVTGKDEFHGPFELGKQYGSEQLPEPIDWQTVQSQYVERMKAKGYQYIGYRWRRPLKNRPTNDMRVAMQIVEKGMHRITYEDLLAQGLDWSDINKNHIAVSYQGKGVPRFVGGSRSFSKGSYIDFFANVPQGRDALYDDKAVYTLSINPELKRRAARVKRRPETWDDWHYVSVHIEQQNYYNELSQLDDPWLMHELFTYNNPVEQSYTFSVEQVVVEQPLSILLASLGGVTDFPERDTNDDGEVDDEHHVRVFINDIETPIYDGHFDGMQAHFIDVTFPSQYLRVGENSLRVQLVDDTGYDFSLIGVDSLTVSYPVSSIEKTVNKVVTFSDSNTELNSNDGMKFKAQRRGLVAYAYQDDHNLARLSISRLSREEFAIPKIASGKANYWVSKTSELLKPNTVFVLPEKNVLVTQPSDLLIISHPNFIGGALDSYAKARTEAGVSNQIISTEDIANSYGVDVPLPQAIKRFLQDTADRVDYESVLLVGGHSYDYLNHLSNDASANTVNFLPTFYRPIWLVNFSPTDLPFVDFNDDGRPEKNIGRWPVRTIENLQTIIDKSIKWQGNADDRRDTGLEIVMVADEKDRLDFSRALDDVSQQIIANNLPVQNMHKIYIDELKQDPNVAAGQVFQSARSQMLETVNEGADWLIYNGHASPSAWSFQSLLNTQAVAQMGNVDNPMMVMPLACYTTYYESPSNDTLAHQLLFNGNHGAVAIHGAMMLGEYYGNLKMAEEILDATNDETTIGASIKAAKGRLPVNYLNTSYNWSLLGDPTLPMQ